MFILYCPCCLSALPTPVPMLIWDVWVLWIFGNWGLGDHSLAQKLYPSICYPYIPYWLLFIWKSRNCLKVEIGGAGFLSTDRNLRWESCDQRLGSGSHTFWYLEELQYFKCLSEPALSRVWIIQIIWKSFLWTSQTPLQIVFLLSVNVDWEFRPESHKHFNVVKNSIRDRKLI